MFPSTPTSTNAAMEESSKSKEKKVQILRGYVAAGSLILSMPKATKSKLEKENKKTVYKIKKSKK